MWFWLSLAQPCCVQNLASRNSIQIRWSNDYTRSSWIMNKPQPNSPNLVHISPANTTSQKRNGALCDITDYNSTWYIVTVLAAVTISCVMLSMQRSRKPFWSSSKSMNSWTATSARMPMRIWLIRAMNLSSHLMAKESEIENGHS